MEIQGLGEHINRMRKAQGLTSEQLSEKCHISTPYLRQIESGHKTPSMPIFMDICNALNTTPNDLLQDALVFKEINHIDDLVKSWNSLPPLQQDISCAVINSVLSAVSKHRTLPLVLTERDKNVRE